MSTKNTIEYDELIGYLDQDYVLPKDLPFRIMQYIDEAEKAYIDKNAPRYHNKVNSIESVSKQMLLNGTLKQQDFNTIWRRYGL